MDKKYYIDEGIRQLSNTDFFIKNDPTDWSGVIMCSRGHITDQITTCLPTDVDGQNMTGLLTNS